MKYKKTRTDSEICNKIPAGRGRCSGSWKSVAGVLFLTVMLGVSGVSDAKGLGALEREVAVLQELLEHHLRTLEAPREHSPRSLMKRFLDGLVLYEMKDYGQASVIFMDLINNHGKSRAAQQARFYLADCFYKRREYRSAIQHYEKVVERGSRDEHYQQSLQRLLELSFRMDDHSGVYQIVERIEKIPRGQRDPGMEYALGKYFYFRGLLDRAMQVFAAIPLSSEYGNQARYFTGVINVKNGRLKEALRIFDEGVRRMDGLETKEKPLRGKDREIRDMFIMALARLYYHNDDPDNAIKYYSRISRRSEQFEHALYELAWAYLKAWEFYRAIKSLELLALAAPDSRYVAESKILVGNLHILARRFDYARKMFSETAEENRPVYQALRRLHGEHWSTDNFLEMLAGTGEKALDSEIALPGRMMDLIKSRPRIRKALESMQDMKDLRSEIDHTERMIERIERRIGDSGSISAFPELAGARARANEVETRLAGLSARIAAKLGRAVRSDINPQELADWNRLEKERSRLKKIIDEMPSSTEDFEQRVRRVRKLFDVRERDLHKLTVTIQGLQAQLVAIETYYSSTEIKQKLDPAVVNKMITEIKEEIAALQKKERSISAAIEDGRNSAGMDEETLEHERKVRERYNDILMRQKRIVDAVKERMGGDGRRSVERIEVVLQRAEAVRNDLKKYNERIDGRLAQEVGRTRRILAEEKENVRHYREILQEQEPKTRSVAAGVTRETMNEISKDLYDLLIKADLGLLDVAWAVKDDQSSRWAEFTIEQTKKLQALEKRFEEVRGR